MYPITSPFSMVSVGFPVTPITCVLSQHLSHSGRDTHQNNNSAKKIESLVQLTNSTQGENSRKLHRFIKQDSFEKLQKWLSFLKFTLCKELVKLLS